MLELARKKKGGGGGFVCISNVIVNKIMLTIERQYFIIRNEMRNRC